MNEESSGLLSSDYFRLEIAREERLKAEAAAEIAKAAAAAEIAKYQGLSYEEKQNIINLEIKLKGASKNYIEKYLKAAFISALSLIVLGSFEFLQLAKYFPIFIEIGIAGFVIKLVTELLFDYLQGWEYGEICGYFFVGISVLTCLFIDFYAIWKFYHPVN